MRHLACLIAAFAAAPVAAQTANLTSERESAAAGMLAAVTIGDGAGAYAATLNAENAAVESQYAADMDAYDDDIRAHHVSTFVNETRWRQQQHAYAEAMAQWRIQMAGCRASGAHGCARPSPEPASFW